MTDDKYAALALYLVPGATPGLKAEIARALERVALEAKIEAATFPCCPLSCRATRCSNLRRYVDALRAQLAALDAEAK